MRILIADDNDDSLEMLHAALEGYGYQVEAVRDGHEALEAARRNAPDMIISDIMMPRMDGFAFCRAVKSDPSLRDIPFIFYTATYVDSQDEKLAMSLGAARYLLKPQEPERFQSVILEELARCRELRPGSTPQAEDARIDEMYASALARKLDKKVHELERERAELARKEAWLFSLISTAPCAIICFEPDGSIIELNSEAKRLLDLDGEVKGKLCREVFCSHGTIRPQQCLSAIAGVLPVTGFETRVRKADGSERILAWNLARLDSTRGGVAGIIAVAYDMTQFRRTEAEANQLREQLDRVRRLESLGRLAGGIAHDFNNLLTPIMVCAGLSMQKQNCPPDLSNSLKMILEAAESARDLTSQLLSFSRKQVLERKPLDLNMILLEFEKLLKRLVPATISISIDAPPLPGKVIGDRSQFEQILLNLTVNAADAMPDGGVLSITVAKAEPGGEFPAAQLDGVPEDYLLLTVRDTGCGIRTGDMNRIFEPFFTTKETGKGTGLGLATVFGIVKQQGGAITVESSPGCGTVFRLFFPCVGEPQSAPEIAKQYERVAGQGETILMAEDHDMVRQVTTLMLEETGFRVIAASSAEEALVRAGGIEGDISLLLTDVVMTGMNGSELYQRLRIERPGLKVLYMSGYADGEILGPMLQDSDSHFILKPFSPNALAAKIRDILSE